MKFEWDEVKRQTNIRKHGIDFVDAMRVSPKERQDYETAIRSSPDA